MKTARYAALLLGAGAIALAALSGERIFAQSNDPNAYPNPYQLQ
jgi:hypothetical protein